jgi:sugar O-acyltransferase (sialic acid O-acetyltransferase NeuD family)
MKKIIIFGNSEIADLAHYYFSNDSQFEVVAFTIDDCYIKNDTFNQLPLVPFSKIEKEFPPKEYLIHVALSYKKLNKLREEKYNLCLSKGYEFATYLSSKSIFLNDINLIGRNSFILENQVIQRGVHIGNNVMIWSGNHIGHNTKIGDHTYISSHVVISGNCTIGRRCFFGVNSAIKDFIDIEDDCFVTMGSNITKDMKKGSISINSKTEIYDNNSKISKIIKKKYFDL